ncbi:hypothetical protein [uncultured Brevundimonas sp.]|uniref:hypothetical protein n=1 Tax=uncultured Brevundimonas sp. TaxID=213418 RepID=UPI0025D24089|nr:hypothetical protein [uncultured Brevundimonas sp.]
MTIFVQTSDAFKYAEMVGLTSKSVIAYTAAKSLQYEMFLGIKKGTHPWHATFNRVFILDEMIERGLTGWVCYMDADAWIEDQSFDVERYLDAHADHAAIFTSSLASDNWWDVNAGVFFLNLSNEVGVRFAKEWKARCLAAWPHVEHATNFPQGGPDDQSILHEILAASPEYKAAIWVESPELINSAWATFIRQHLRSNATDFRSRVAHIREEISRILDPHSTEAESAFGVSAVDVVAGLYEGILGRPADGGADNSYIRTVERRGIRDGVSAVANYMVNSDEFRSKLMPG